MHRLVEGALQPSRYLLHHLSRLAEEQAPPYISIADHCHQTISRLRINFWPQVRNRVRIYQQPRLQQSAPSSSLNWKFPPLHKLLKICLHSRPIEIMVGPLIAALGQAVSV